MPEEKNQLLGYTIDKLIKTFNPYRKERVNKFHFYKLMNLLDYRLQKQGIDIKLPGYWYKFGFYTEEKFLDDVLPYPFSGNYLIDTSIYPSKIKVDYTGKVSIKEMEIISKTVGVLYDKYGWKEGYGDSAKRESYEINSPYKFNTVFQDYIFTTNKNTNHISENLKNDITVKLNELLPEFPFESFPELSSIHYDWDDTTRLVLDCAPDEIKLKLIKQLRDEFWGIYAKRVRIQHNQNIPVYVIERWKSDYESELPTAEKTVEDIRNEMISKYYIPSERSKKLAKIFMNTLYDISKGV
jgi:hypothetical protein